MRKALILLGILLLAAVILTVAFSHREISKEELARRCAATTPAWNGYQEDIKAIGAGPVAQWHGIPTALEVDGNQVRLEMVLTPPWNQGPAALPVLIKTPEGHVVRDQSWTREGSTCIYTFAVAGDENTSVPPWLDIQYPHTKKKIYLDLQGQWRAPVSE